MRLCWNENPAKRLTFSEMVKKYDGILPDMIQANKQRNTTSNQPNAPPDIFEFKAVDVPMPSDSLFAAIVAHLQQTPSESFQLADTLLLSSAEYTYVPPPNGITYSNLQLPVHVEGFKDHSRVYDETPDHVTMSNGHVTSSADHMNSCKQTSDDRLGGYVTMNPAPPIKPNHSVC